jgi:hypothetical protein
MSLFNRPDPSTIVRMLAFGGIGAAIGFLVFVMMLDGRSNPAAAPGMAFAIGVGLAQRKRSLWSALFAAIVSGGLTFHLARRYSPWPDASIVEFFNALDARSKMLFGLATLFSGWFALGRPQYGRYLFGGKGDQKRKRRPIGWSEAELEDDERRDSTIDRNEEDDREREFDSRELDSLGRADDLDIWRDAEPSDQRPEVDDSNDRSPELDDRFKASGREKDAR